MARHTPLAQRALLLSVTLVAYERVAALVRLLEEHSGAEAHAALAHATAARHDLARALVALGCDTDVALGTSSGEAPEGAQGAP